MPQLGVERDHISCLAVDLSAIEHCQSCTELIQISNTVCQLLATCWPNSAESNAAVSGQPDDGKAHHVRASSDWVAKSGPPL